MAIVKANVQGEILMRKVMEDKDVDAAKTLTCEIWNTMYQLAEGREADFTPEEEDFLIELKEKAADILNLSLSKMRCLCPLCQVFYKFNGHLTGYKVSSCSDACPLKENTGKRMGCGRDSVYHKAMTNQEAFLSIIDQCQE